MTGESRNSWISVEAAPSDACIEVLPGGTFLQIRGCLGLKCDNRLRGEYSKSEYKNAKIASVRTKMTMKDRAGVCYNNSRYLIIRKLCVFIGRGYHER